MRPGGVLSRLALLLVAAAPLARATPVGEVAARAWVSVRAPHVEVVTDAGRATAERVATQLENLRAVLALAAPALVVESAPVQVIVFRDAALFEAYAPRWRGVRDEVSGFFQPGPDRRRLLFVAERDRTPALAQHEYTHALLDASMPDLPLWLNEGLAEYFSTFRVDGGTARAGAPIRTHLDWLAAHDLLPLRELFAVGHGSADYHEGDRRGTFYAQSWALTHLLLSGTDDDLGRLERCLVAAREGEPFPAVFRRVFGDEGTLRVRLDAYMDRPDYAVREWRLSRALDDVPLVWRANVPAAEVLASLGNGLLARDPAPREFAEEHLRRSLALSPGLPEALAGSGWLAQMRGRPDEARTWYERVLASDPVPVPALRLAATEWLLDVSRRNDNAERDRVAATLRQALARAQAKEPDPELEALIARTWVLAYGDDPEPGLAHARRAAAALPGRSDVRLDLLALDALTGRTEEARALEARFFASDPRPDVAANVRRALYAGEVRRANQRISAGDSEGAEAILRAARDRVTADPDLTREADAFLDRMRETREKNRELKRENAAIAEYNRGVEFARQRQHREAAAAFRRAAQGSGSASFQKDALALAERMELRVKGEHALELARAGRREEAIAILEGMQRSGMVPEDRRWVEQSLAALRGRPAR